MSITLKGRTIKKLLVVGGGGEGGWAESKKKFAQGKMKGKKIHARQLTLKNIHALDNEEKFLRLENPPPNNFSNGPSLSVSHRHFRTRCVTLPWGELRSRYS